MRIDSGFGILAMCLTLALNGNVFAIEQAQASKEPLVVRASVLVGKEVYSRSGERLGQIKDIVISHSGEPSFVVIAYGGFLGMGDRLTAVPWDEAQITPEKDKVVLGLSKEVLIQAPTFDNESWSRLAEPTWVAQIWHYYEMEQGETATEPVFVLLDSDADGQISKSEAEQFPFLIRQFGQLDRDKNGRLSRSEFAAFEVSGAEGKLPAAPAQPEP